MKYISIKIETTDHLSYVLFVLGNQDLISSNLSYLLASPSLSLSLFDRYLNRYDYLYYYLNSYYHVFFSLISFSFLFLVRRQLKLRVILK